MDRLIKCFVIELRPITLIKKTLAHTQKLDLSLTFNQGKKKKELNS